MHGLGDVLMWACLFALPFVLLVATARLARHRGAGGSALGAALDEVNAAFQPQKPAVTTVRQQKERRAEDEDDGDPPEPA